jgi:hypothetical protein
MLVGIALAILALCDPGGTSSGVVTEAAADETPGHPAYVRSITFSDGVVDQARTTTWKHGTIGFGRGRPRSEFTETGIKVHGLTCSEATNRHFDCYLFMAMKRFESRAHFCEILPENKNASFKRALRIDCPREIDYDP